MDEKQMLRATLNLIQHCGNLMDEVGNLESKIEDLQKEIHKLFDKLCPFNTDDVDSDNWDYFVYKIINYCEGVQQ